MPATSHAVARLARVEALLGGPIDRTLPIAAIERLVAEGVTEFDQLDFKAVMYSSSEKDKAELAKDVCAFANHTGGLIVVGVADSGGVASHLLPWAADDTDVRHVQSVLAARTAPFPTFDAFVIGAGPDAYLLIAVPPGPWAPHAVISPGGPNLEYPVRNGSQTRHLREPELADRYRDRFRAATDQVDRLDRVVGEATAQLDRSAPWIFLATVPNRLGHGHVTDAFRREVDLWMANERWPGLLQRYVTSTVSGVGVGRVISAYRSQPGVPSSVDYGEFYADGCSFVAVQPSSSVDDKTGCWALGARELPDITVALLATCAQHASRSTGPGEGIVSLGVIEATGDVDMALFDHRDYGVGYRPVTDVRRRQVPASRHTVDLGAAATDATATLTTARLVLTDVLQAFGVAEVKHIDSEGRLRPDLFGSTWASTVRAWADVHGAGIV